MKHYLKFLLFVLSLVLAVCLVSCGGAEETLPEPETEGPVETSVSADGEHEHTSTAAPIRSVDPTCTQKGYSDYRCDICEGVFRKYVPTANHEYEENWDSKTGLSKLCCTGCDDELIPIDGGAGIGFAAYCRGDLTIDFKVSGAAAELEFLMDGKVLSTKTYEEGDHSVAFAESIPEGEHTFSLNCKNTDSLVDVINIDIDGNMNRPNAVILEMETKVKDKGDYGTFYVYVQTSDPSGEYYVRYKFAYEYNLDYYSDKADTTNNIDCFRIKGAQLVQVESVTDTEVKSKTIYDVLHPGEVFLAIKENNSVDFIGGYHGDEHMEEFELYADGVAYVPGEAKKVVTCSYIEVIQTTLLNRCNMPAYYVARHEQFITIDSTGIQNKKTLEWLVSDFKINKAYLQMFTMRRLDGSNVVCENIEAFNANGVRLGKATASGSVAEDYTVLSGAGNRSIRYSSDTSGVSAEVGFEILDQSVALNSSYVLVRVYNDNKWYADFRSVKNGNNPEVGEKWKIKAHYHIDYVAPTDSAE